ARCFGSAPRICRERYGITIFVELSLSVLPRDEHVRQFQGIARRVKRKLEAINAAIGLDDLAIAPSNRLEKLKGDMSAFHSIRVNDQWRIIFKWIAGEPYDIRITDYTNGREPWRAMSLRR